MFEKELAVSQLNESMAAMLVKDIPDERLAEQPVTGVKMNHGAWVLGHLGLTADFVNRFMTGEPMPTQPVAPQGWWELFSPGSQPETDRSKYPSKQAPLDALEHGRAALPKILAGVPAQAWDEPHGMAIFEQAGLKTRRDVIGALLTSHGGFHNGQLSAWRRAMGFPPAFGKPKTD